MTDEEFDALWTSCEWRQEIDRLRLDEEGAKEAFGAVVQQKLELAAECNRLRRLLDAAYSDIRKVPNA